MIYQAWPNDLPTLTLVALALIAFFLFITHKRKVPPDYELILRRSIQRLFTLAVKKDYEAAASLLATSAGEVLLFSQQPDKVKERCLELQELAALGGVSIEKVLPQSEREYPDFVCEVAVLGPKRVVTQQVWRWVKGRYAWIGEGS